MSFARLLWRILHPEALPPGIDRFRKAFHDNAGAAQKSIAASTHSTKVSRELVHRLEPEIAKQEKTTGLRRMQLDFISRARGDDNQ